VDDPILDTDSRDTVPVIRSGGIGGFVQALSTFAAIRMHHSVASITLLTDSDLSEFAGAAPYFDKIETHADLAGGACSLLRDQAWSIVYDLDASSCTDSLFQYSKNWRHSLT
jgi:ADP-heptose:LPS heptosyltransferase